MSSLCQVCVKFVSSLGHLQIALKTIGNSSKYHNHISGLRFVHFEIFPESVLSEILGLKSRRSRGLFLVLDTRNDFLHKLSTKVIRENQTIILDDLNVSGMVKKNYRCKTHSGRK